jgi:hypothetical protein
MEKTTSGFIKEEHEGQLVYCRTAEDGILMSDWYIGLTDSLIAEDKISEIKRMQKLN